MSGTSLQPQTSNRSMSRRPEDGDPFMPLRRQMSRLFDDFFSGPMVPRFPMMTPAPMLAAVVTPQIEVSETDKEIQIAAELPGIDPKDVEVTLADDVLTIRGEKQAQRQEGQDRDYHLAERSYGTFARYLRLPFHLDPQNIRAMFKDGVLTLTIPKPEEAQQKVHRIAVSTDGASTNGFQQPDSTPAQQQAAAAE
jgi:HSP20 family protein